MKFKNSMKIKKYNKGMQIKHKWMFKLLTLKRALSKRSFKDFTYFIPNSKKRMKMEEKDTSFWLMKFQKLTLKIVIIVI